MAGVVFGLTQKGRRKLIDAEGYSYVGNSISKNRKIEYWKCTVKDCPGRFIYQPGTGEGKLSLAHLEDEQPDPTWRTRDAAIERLKELTLSVEGSVKAIDLVRQVLKEVPPEVRPLMPVENSLIERVKRWAKVAGNIELIKHTREDYLIPEIEEPSTGVPHSSMTNSSNIPASCTTAAPIGKLYPVPAYRRNHCIGRFKPLKRVDEHGNEIGVATLDEFLYGSTDWQGDISSNRLEGQEKSTATLREGVTKVSMADGENIVGDENVCMDLGKDDFQIDLKPDEAKQISPERPSKSSLVISTSSNPLTKKSLVHNNKSKNAVKSGDRCFVCGDELIVSETLAASQEIFRKACCYLNVKSEGEWFPRGENSKFYSFCEFCTDEITKIHSLYCKVDELQSLIFKKVETVEKRIADAEIVDNWMAEAPRRTVVRFEGFRKQVMINYRNKLKLRREIRYGKKTGDKIIEILPVSSAHMFASDPSETQAFRKIANSDIPSAVPSYQPPQLSRRTRGRPKSKKRKEELKTETANETGLPFLNDCSIAFDNVDDHDFCPDFDDSQDTMSEVSEKETKFWEADPTKPDVGQRRCKQPTNRYTTDDLDDFEDINDGMEENVPSEEEDDSDEEWGSTMEKNLAVTGKQSSKQSKVPKKIILEKKRRTKAKVQKLKHSDKPPRISKFPDAILTKDGRVFMQGIEIIKNPPGAYKPLPYSVSFSCGACGKILPKFWNIRQHICGHHLGMYKCHHCDKEFTDPKAVDKHIAMKHAVPQYEDCPICGKPIKMYKNQNMYFHRWCHLNREEKLDPQHRSWRPPGAKDPNPPLKQKEKQTFMCGQCGKNFILPSVLRRHEMRHAQEETGHQESTVTMCQFCGKSYATRKGLTRHVRRCTSNAQGRLNAKSYPCPKCPTRCSSSQARWTHIRRFDRNKIGDLPFSCSKCTRSFNTRIGLRQHKRVCIDGEKGYGGSNRKALENQSSSLQSNSDDADHEMKTDPTAASSPTGYIPGHSSVGFGPSQFDINNTSALGFNYNFMGENPQQ